MRKTLLKRTPNPTWNQPADKNEKNQLVGREAILRNYLTVKPVARRSARCTLLESATTMTTQPYRKPQRKTTTLPPYEPPSPTNPISISTSASPMPAATMSSEARGPILPRSDAGRPSRRRSRLSTFAMDYLYSPVVAFSGDPMRRLMMMTISEGDDNMGNSFFGGEMHAPPEPIAQPMSPAVTQPPPPSYAASVKPMLLWLGTWCFWNVASLTYQFR